MPNTTAVHVTSEYRVTAVVVVVVAVPLLCHCCIGVELSLRTPDDFTGSITIRFRLPTKKVLLLYRTSAVPGFHGDMYRTAASSLLSEQHMGCNPYPCIITLHRSKQQTRRSTSPEL